MSSSRSFFTKITFLHIFYRLLKESCFAHKSIITIRFGNLDSWGAMRKEGTRNCNEEQNIDYLFKQDR